MKKKYVKEETVDDLLPELFGVSEDTVYKLYGRLAFLLDKRLTFREIAEELNLRKTKEKGVLGFLFAEAIYDYLVWKKNEEKKNEKLQDC